MSPPFMNTEVKLSNAMSLSPPRRIAVSLQGAWKQYGSGKNAIPVLQNMDMTVPQGTIYSLLGASGCGKTTLLACIVGMRSLDRGDCSVFGTSPGTPESGIPGNRVGYMPQEIALYGEFSIGETMNYFGRIYGMTKSEIKEKTVFLVKFLDLPSVHKQINTLSGGQQRRVSFAVALLHDPEILILDEPTVGVDPLLRQSIWTHLTSLTTTGRTTVIITTHYIEEARQADKIGLMRSGRLLAEDSPANLLKVHECLSLEDVFLRLCIKDKETNNSNNALLPPATTMPNKFNNINSTKTTEPNIVSVYKRKKNKHIEEGSGAEENGIVGFEFKNSKHHSGITNITDSKDRQDGVTNSGFCNLRSSMNRLWALVIKNLICMWRNIGFLLFIFVLPSIQVVLFCLAIGREPIGMNVGIINYEVPLLGPCDAIEGCTTANLSCRYLSLLPSHSVHLIHYSNESSAISEIEKGQLWGYISFPSNFSAAIIERGIAGNLVDNETIHTSRIRIKMDMSNQQIAFSLQRIFLETFQTFSKALLSDCEYDSASGDIPLFFEEPVYGHDHPSFTEFMAPGVVLSIIFFMSVALTGSAFITEKKEGMWERSLVAGVTTGEAITAHLITQYFVMVGQTALVFLFMMVVFEIQVRGPLAWSIIITLLQGTYGMALGFLISIFCTEERHALQLALGSFYPNLLLSGVVWPIESMPKILRDIAYVMPQTLASESMRSMLTRGWGISHPAVWPGFVSSIIWSVIFWLLAVILARFRRR